MAYYTPLILLVWMALFVLGILTKENDRGSRRKSSSPWRTRRCIR